MSKAEEIEKTFARQFVAADWMLFKTMAEANLSEAVFLKKKDMPQSGLSPLLARNIRKRLLIGIGAELLLKSSFLKAGYAINLPAKGGLFPFPSRFELIGSGVLNKASTATFKQCLKHINSSMTLQREQTTREGLEIAQIFRNKEAHGIVKDHPYCAATYTLIEDALKDVYWGAFSEKLVVKIGMTAEDKPVWRLDRQEGKIGVVE